MKKILAIALTVLFCATVAFADEVEETLAGKVNEQIRNTTRQMIQAGINSDDAIKMTQLMLRNQFSQQQTLKAQQMLMQALQSGLPVKPIMDKAYEGMAKKVHSRSVLQAMETVRSRYAFACKQAGQLTEESDKISSLGALMADSMTAGVAMGDLELIMGCLQDRTRKMERKRVDDLATDVCVALRDMARLGASSEAITDVVSHALSQNYTAGDIKILRQSFVNNARHALPDSIAKSYARRIGQGERAEGLGSSAAGGAGASGGAGSGGSNSGGSGPGSGGENGGGSGGGGHGGGRD